MSKNIKLVENSYSMFSEDDIQKAVDVVNMFSSVVEDSKTIIATLLLKHANNIINLDEESQKLLIEWTKNLTMLREHMKLLNDNTKFH